MQNKTIKFAGYELTKTNDTISWCDFECLNTSEIGSAFEIFVKNNRYYLNFYYCILSSDPGEEIDFHFSSKSLELLEKKFKKHIVPEVERLRTLLDKVYNKQKEELDKLQCKINQ